MADRRSPVGPWDCRAGCLRPTPMSQWDAAARLSYWAFHADRRPAYMRFAYLHLGSDAAAEQTVDAAFDSIMSQWLRMLHMDRLDAYAWTVLKHCIVDRERRRSPGSSVPSRWTSAPSRPPSRRLTRTSTKY